MSRTKWHRASCRFLSSLILITLSAAPALSAELRLTISGINSDRGKILIGLYDDENVFRNATANRAKRGLMPDLGRLIGTAIRAQRGEQSTVFTQLPPGRYALIVIHDENDNGLLDENFLGLPMEGYGFGNNAQGFLGAPSFDAAAINVENADVRAHIKLIYPGSFPEE